MTKGSPQDLDKVVREVQDHWQRQGKHWDMNPPLASHFGGVWERAIGQVRQIMQGYLLPKQDRLLTREEFHTMLLQAARIVNSTPLHEAPESPNDSQPITPHHLITQRDDGCLENFSHPTIYEADLIAYGANRWKRIEALSEELAKYWKHYIFQIGTDEEKWTIPARNASVGDVVLLKEKTLSPSRLDWDTGTIISATVDKDNLVRKVMVQPHKKPGQNSCPKPKERAIHDLVLLKAITAKDKPNPDTTTVPNAPPEARVLLCSILADDPELFKIYPEECQTRPPMPNTNTSPKVAPIMPQDDAIFLQTSATALLHKIHELRREEPGTLNPEAPPLTPLPSPNPTTDLCLLVTTAEAHPQPKEKP